MKAKKHKSLSSKMKIALVSTIIIAAAAFIGRFYFFVEVNDKLYSIFTQSFTFTDSDKIKDYSVFNRFKSLKSLDFSSTDFTQADYDYIASQVKGNVKILWNVPVGNDLVPSDTESITITDKTAVVDCSFYKYFTDLKEVNVSSMEVSPQLQSIIEGARECFPDIKINCKTSVYGVEFSSDTEMLDLNAIDITDLSDLDLTISLFPNLKSVEICSCRLDNEVIAALNDKYPDTKVVWLLKIERYSIRTDVQVFSTLSPTAKKLIFDKTALPIFKYCTDLRALDIGHNGISDLRPLTNLKKLHTLILADNYLTDISPLTELKELNYVEFQVNQIKDISPLSELPLMSDVKIDRNDGLKNITSLTKCKNLKKLFCSQCRVSNAEIAELKQNLPEDCMLRYTKKYSDISYWRTDEKNANIREAFANWQNVKEFPDWQTIVYWDRDVYDFSSNHTA